MKKGLISRLKNAAYAGATAAALGSAALTGYGCKDATGPEKRISQTVNLQNLIGINYKATLENIASATRKIFRNDTLIDTKTITGPTYSESTPRNIKGDYLYILEAPGAKPDSSRLTVPDYPAIVYLGPIPKIYKNDTVKVIIDSVVDPNYEDNPVTITGLSSLDGKVQPSMNGNQIQLISGDSIGQFSYRFNLKTAIGIATTATRTDTIRPDMIAFSSVIPNVENDEIYTINLDGNNLRKLTSISQNIMPTWSFDAMQITYQNSGNGLYNTFTMFFDGSNKTRIPSSLNLMNPSFSPDGSEIIFAFDDYSLSTKTGTIEGIAKSKSNGTGFTILYQEPYSAHEPGNPKFSPDGKMVSFEDYLPYGNYEIVVMGADGSNPTNVTNNPASDGQARWFRDGSGLFFTSDRGGSNLDVYKQKFQQTATRVTYTGALAPDISPDGRKFIFARPNTPYLYLQNSDGTGPVDSIKTVGFAGYPTFRPRVR